MDTETTLPGSTSACGILCLPTVIHPQMTVQLSDIKIQLTSANLLWCKGESHFILAPQVSPLLFLLYFHFQPPRDHLHQEAHRTDMLFTLSKGLNTQYSLIQSGLPARQVDKSTAPRPGQTRTEPGTSIVRNTSK